MVVGGAKGILRKESFCRIMWIKGGYIMKVIQKIIKFIKENKLFSFSIFLTGIFIVSPLFLKIQIMNNALSGFMYSLKEQGYKSSYVETLGAILGTFLAISGALWTQRKFEQEAELKEEEERKYEKFLIIYYDFEFAFNDIKNNMFFFQYKKEGKMLNVLEDIDIELFKDCWKKFKVHIYHDWIANVASVSKYFTKEEVKNIYKIYGDLVELSQIFNEPIKEISDSELKIAYNKMYQYVTVIIALKNPPYVEEVELKDSIKSLLEKLQNVGGF